MPGPVAYQVQSARFTAGVISRGAVHVSPSSALDITQTLRPSRLVPAMMASSRSVPRLRVASSQMTPLFSSTTGQGSLRVSGPPSPTTCMADHDRPPSRLRLTTRSMSPASSTPPRRASAKARSVPFGVLMSEGMRYQWTPSSPATYTSTSGGPNAVDCTVPNAMAHSAAATAPINACAIPTRFATEPRSVPFMHSRTGVPPA